MTESLSLDSAYECLLQQEQHQPASVHVADESCLNPPLTLQSAIKKIRSCSLFLLQ